MREAAYAFATVGAHSPELLLVLLKNILCFSESASLTLKKERTFEVVLRRAEKQIFFYIAGV
jgi:hypothetical protein